MGMGKTIQAISLIVTHRTDDMARIELPAAADTATATQHADRPKLRLRTAGGQPPPPASSNMPATTGSTLETTAPPHGSNNDQPPAPVDTTQQQGNPTAGPTDTTTTTTQKTQPKKARAKKPPATADPMATTDAAIAAGVNIRSTAHDTQCCGHDGAGPSTAGAAPDWCKATLVICPVVAVIQWRGEIARYTAPGSVKVCGGLGGWGNGVVVFAYVLHMHAHPAYPHAAHAPCAPPLSSPPLHIHRL